MTKEQETNQMLKPRSQRKAEAKKAGKAFQAVDHYAGNGQRAVYTKQQVIDPQTNMATGKVTRSRQALPDVPAPLMMAVK